MLGSVALLRQVTPINKQNSESESTNSTIKSIPWSKLSLIAVMALSLSWGVRLLMATVTKAVNNSNYMILLGVLLAIMALAAGNLAVKIGNDRAMLIGISGAILILLLLNFTTHPLILGLALIIWLISLNLVVNGAIPLVINWIFIRESEKKVKTVFRDSLFDN